MVKASASNAGGAGLIPCLGAKIPHAFWSKTQNIREKHTVTNSIKTLKMVHMKKEVLKKKFIIWEVENILQLSYSRTSALVYCGVLTPAWIAVQIVMVSGIFVSNIAWKDICIKHCNWLGPMFSIQIFWCGLCHNCTDAPFLTHCLGPSPLHSQHMHILKGHIN